MPRRSGPTKGAKRPARRTCVKHGCKLKTPPYAGRGPYPKYCLKHQSRGDVSLARLKKRKGTKAARAEADAADVELGRGERVDQQIAKSLDAAAPELLAIALGIKGTPAEAAKVAGITATQKELDRLTKLARRHHKPLTERQPTAIGEVLLQTVGLAAVRLRCELPRLAPHTLASSIQMLVKSTELIQGSAQHAWREITFIIPGELEPDDAEP